MPACHANISDMPAPARGPVHVPGPIVSFHLITLLDDACSLLTRLCAFSPAEFSTVVKKDTAVVAGDVLAKTRATVEQNINKASEVAVLAARFPHSTVHAVDHLSV